METTQKLISPLGENSLDIEKIRDAFKDFLRVNNVINDVDYEGSNISILIDIISHAIYGINSTNALLFNEMMLPTATKRPNIIQLAKTLGYNIQRSISAKLKVKVKPQETLEAGENVILKRGTRFSIGDGIIFYNKDDVILQDNDPKEVEIEEGVLITSEEDERLFQKITSPTDKFILPYQRIEENSIRVYVKREGTDDFIQFERVKSLLDLETNTQYFEDYDADSGFVILRFKFANLGQTLNINDEIKVEFALTLGRLGNNLLDVAITPTKEISNKNNEITIELVEEKYPKTYGGSDEESNLSIKTNAPRFYNSANRLVTSADYEAHLEADSKCEIAGAWGGEEMPQIIRGRIYFSSIPQNGNNFHTDKEVAYFLDLLAKKRIISTEREYWHPVFYIFDIDIKIIGNVIDLSHKQDLIKEVFERTYQNSIRKFHANIFYSKIVRDLELIFENDKNASIEIALKPKIRIYPENFKTLFKLDDQCTQGKDEVDVYSDELKWMDEKLLITLPTLPNEYFLVKGKEKISASGKDIKSYLLNGWNLVKSTQGFFNLEISGQGIEIIDNGDLELPDGTKIKKNSFIKWTSEDKNTIMMIGQIDHNRNEMWVDKAFESIVNLNGYFDFDVGFGDDCQYPVSSALRRNMFPVIGDIKFV